MPRPKGLPKTGGRKVGTPNKTTSQVKDALSDAFEGIGGLDALQGWARDNQTAFYQLWGKLLPLQVNGAGENGEHLVDASLTVTFKRPDGNPVS